MVPKAKTNKKKKNQAFIYLTAGAGKGYNEEKAQVPTKILQLFYKITFNLNVVFFNNKKS